MVNLHVIGRRRAVKGFAHKAMDTSGARLAILRQNDHLIPVRFLLLEDAPINDTLNPTIVADTIPVLVAYDWLPNTLQMQPLLNDAMCTSIIR